MGTSTCFLAYAATWYGRGDISLLGLPLVARIPTSLHFYQPSIDSHIHTHIQYLDGSIFVYSEMAAEAAIVTKKTSKLIKQTMSVWLAMQTTMANDLALFNNGPRRHALLRQ
jgi:hypothetical protein